MSNKTNGTGTSKRAFLECGVGAFRMGPVLDEFTALEGGRSGNGIAAPIFHCYHMANARFAGGALAVISLVLPTATIKELT